MKEELQSILERIDLLGSIIRNESKVLEMELDDRQKLGLKGRDAIEHYNAWMDFFHLTYLKVVVYE